MIKIDIKNNYVTEVTEAGEVRYPIDSAEAFSIVSKAWLRCGWDNKYVYSFSWLGRPIIQLPEDLLRIQEVIFRIMPDVIVETGVAHGGSLIFYASLFKSIGKGRVIGVDVEIRPHNRKSIEEHPLSSSITLVEGSSIDEDVIQKVKSMICENERVMVILDSNHSKSHVFSELVAYSPLVSVGSYIVVCDGIMKEMVGAPRSKDDWDWNNPMSAIEQFLISNSRFKYDEPQPPFNEGFITERVTYWPNAYLQRYS
jgi:cephalosporin hydroxylase